MKNKEVLEFLKKGHLIKEFQGIRKVSVTIDGWKLRSSTLSKFLNNGTVVVDSVIRSEFTVSTYFKLKIND